MRFVAESVVYGSADAASLLRETDTDVLLVMQAVNNAAAQIRDEQDHRLAKYIIHELAKAMKS